MPGKLNKISEEIIHEAPKWLYKHDVFEKADGSTGDYYYIQKKGMVKILPILPDGRIVLVLQHRYLQDKQSIEFPAGAIEDDQTPEEAARTELREETGYEADELINVGTFEPSNGGMINPGHIFIAHVGDQGEQQLDDTEDIEVLYRRPDEVERMVERNEIWDGPTLAVWAMAHHRFLKESYE